MSPPGPFRNVEFDPVFTGFTAFFLLCDSISLGFYRFDRVPLGSIRFYWIFMLVTVFSLVLLVFYIYRFDFEFY